MDKAIKDLCVVVNAYGMTGLAAAQALSTSSAAASVSESASGSSAIACPDKQATMTF